MSNTKPAKVFEIAKLVKGKGIYMGESEPVDLDWQSLGFKLAVFVSPKPLRAVTGKLLTFNDTAAAIGKLKGWQGHDGCNLDPARYYSEFCDMVREDPEALLGKWMIGPLELVRGLNRWNTMVRPQENMYELRTEADFAKAKPFATARGSVYAHWQWSCTPHCGFPGSVRAVDFRDGSDNWLPRDTSHVNCVPVRLERLAL